MTYSKRQGKQIVKNMKKRAVIYIRYSSHRQDESFSVEYQAKECMRDLESKGYIFVKQYIDEATSGKKTAGRESFHEMIRDAKAGKFDVIIVFSYSRSFRNTRDALNYNHDLKEECGVVIESVIEKIDMSNPHGKFSGTNLFAMHELQSDIIAGHVKAGMYIAAQQGYFLGGTVPFGYKLYGTGEFSRGKERKKYTPHEEERKIVKMMFDMFADGFSLDYVQGVLREMDVKGRRGNVMGIQTIARMLKNEFYIGTREYEIEGYPKLYLENAVPAIIDGATWARVQKRHRDNESITPRKRTKRLYSLTGKIFCEKCGKHMFGVHKGDSVHGKYTYAYYHCSTKKSNKTCDALNIRKDQIEKYCIQEIKKHILNPEAIEHLAKHIAELAGNEPTDIQKQIKEYTKRRSELAEYVKGLVKQQLKGDIPPDILQELSSEYNHEIAEIDLQLLQLENAAASAITVDAVRDYLNDMLENIDTADEHILKSIFDKLIDKIVVSDTGVKVYLIVCPLDHIRDKHDLGQPVYRLCTEITRKNLRQL